MRYFSFIFFLENWEAFKYALSKNKQQQQHQQHQHINHMDNDDLLGIQQSQQKRNNIVNSLGMPHFNGLQSKFSQLLLHNVVILIV